MAEENKDGDDFDIADTVGPAANYAIPNFEGLGLIDTDSSRLWVGIICYNFQNCGSGRE